MAAAAVLGTPSLRVSSWSGRLTILSELEQRYGLTFAYRPDQTEAVMARLESWLRESSVRASMAETHARMLHEKIDVAQWFIEFLEAGAPLPSYCPARKF